jgi:hypothetical protein
MVNLPSAAARRSVRSERAAILAASAKLTAIGFISALIRPFRRLPPAEWFAVVLTRLGREGPATTRGSS